MSLIQSPPRPHAPPTERRGPGWWSCTLALVRKDLRIELRARDTLPPMLGFALAVALLLAFSLPGGGGGRLTAVPLAPGQVPLADVLSGFLWVTVLFAGLIGFARTFETEREEAALDSLVLVPVDRSAVFASKALANLAHIVAVEVIVVPVFALLWNLGAGGWPVFLLVAALADLGFAAVGTLFAALAVQTRSRELMLPLLALPVLVPVFIAAVELTSDLWSGGGLHAVTASGWFGILVGFDVIFSVAGGLAADHVLD